jgi:hypothetical protein
MESWNIKDYILEYDDDTHTYLVNGLCVPSITEILSYKFGKKFDNVDERIVNRAAKKGTQVHKAIEKLCKYGVVSDDIEVKNFLFLQRQYGFFVIDNEVPVILFENDIPIAAGRLDLVLEINEEIYLGDIKRTSVLDKEYLGYQLNLYRIAFQQCYGTNIVGLKGLHLREDRRKFVNIPINEKAAWKLIEEYKRLKNEEI